MTHDTRIALFLMGELVAALRANDSDVFRGLLAEGMQELGVTKVEELLMDWLYSFLIVEEQDRLMGWHLGVSPLTEAEHTCTNKPQSTGHNREESCRDERSQKSSPQGGQKQHENQLRRLALQPEHN